MRPHAALLHFLFGPPSSNYFPSNRVMIMVTVYHVGTFALFNLPFKCNHTVVSRNSGPAIDRISA